MTETNKDSLFYKFKKQFIIFWSIFCLGIISIILLFIGISQGLFGFMPTFEELENPRNLLATEVISSDGVVLGNFFKQNRSFVRYKNLPPHLVNALIATEDVRFRSHSGIDVRGLARVFKGLITGNKNAGGGSTLSQQLAKMLFPRKSFNSKLDMVSRKLKEWVIAVKLEKSYTKDEIVTMYLNKYDYLNLAVGIKSAAKVYFNTIPDSLNLQESAMLVGMAKNSSYFNPLRRPKLTLERRNVVLEQMRKYEYINKQECDSLKKLDLGLNFQKVDHKTGLAPYLREFLRMYLTHSKPNKRNYASYNMHKFKVDSLLWLDDPAFGWCNKNLKRDGSKYNIYSDGLKIYTCIDSRMQKYAEQAVKQHLGKDLQVAFDKEKKYKRNAPYSNDMSKEQVKKNIELAMRRSERYRVLKKKKMTRSQIFKTFDIKRKMKVFTWKGDIDTILTPKDSILYYKGFFRAGFMSMVPQTGEVKAYVGGPNYQHFMYDMVTKGKRQVGSIIKPFLYSVAMQEGLSPCEKVPNIPQTFNLPDGTSWTAKNSSKSRTGQMVTLKWGLANSVNNISGWVLKQFSPDAVVDMAKKMGVVSKIDAVPSIFLGTSEISVAEMVGAYSTFSNKGVYIRPRFVSRIEDSKGNEVAKFSPKKTEAMPEQTAYLMTSLLKGVVQRGTGMRLRLRYDLNNPIGGKTGTTQNHSDGWFMGITPELVSGVWVGAEDRSVHFNGIRLGQGASMALPIFAIYMQKVYADKSLKIYKGDFKKPKNFTDNMDCSSYSTSKDNDEGIEDSEDEFL